MAITINTLVFTREGKYKGVQYLGRLNMDRTVAATIISLCRQYRNGTTAYEVCHTINFYIDEMKEAKKYPGVETLQHRTIEEVKSHMSSVARRSQEGGSKYIPRGIERVPNTVYYVFKGGMQTVK